MLRAGERKNQRAKSEEPSVPQPGFQLLLAGLLRQGRMVGRKEGKEGGKEGREGRKEREEGNEWLVGRERRREGSGRGKREAGREGRREG